MTKDVLLAIQGLQFNASEEDSNIQTITPASYYSKDKSVYVIYDEVMEGTDQLTKNIIHLKDKTMEITKKGHVNVHMIFEENRKSLSNYATPFGDILIGLDTRKISVNEEEHRMHVEVDYVLEVNYEFLANCKISMDISERNGEDFTIFGNRSV